MDALKRDFEIRAQACRSCGKTRELAGRTTWRADMDAFKELERRLRCTCCAVHNRKKNPASFPAG